MKKYKNIKSQGRSAFRILSMLLITIPGVLIGAPLELKDLKESLNANRNVEYIQDKSGSLSIQDVSKNDSKLNWIANQKDKLGFSFTESAYWFRIPIKNSGSKKQALNLHQDYPLIDYLDLYVVQDGRVVREFNYGDRYPYEKREIKYRSLVFPLELGPGESATLYLRYFTSSSLNVDLKLWTPEAFQNYWHSESIVLWIYYGFMIVMCLYNFFLFLSIRDLSYLYYSLYIASWTLFVMALNGLAYQYLWPNSIDWANHCIPFILNVTGFSVAFFIRDFTDLKRHSRITYWIFTAAGILLLAQIPVNLLVESYQTRMVSSTILVGVLIAFCIPVNIYITIKNRIRSGIYFNAAFLVFFSGAILYILKTLNFMPSNFLSVYGMQIGSALEVVLLSLGLADRINVMKQQLEVLNVGLEEKVQERTAELKETLQTVQTMKSHQDGDYFLTSLLLDPLQANQNNSSLTPSETYLKQYKNFDFRTRKSELGGDVCITSRIKLQNRDYVFFTNADAMGKSMQGAGGALVFGAAIRSALLQTQVESQGKTPETWLRDLFFELHGLFESFEGSMLVSCVLGLVDETSGMLWFVNAEHPWVCLYRDGQARYIEEELTNRKLGIFSNNKVHLQLFQLEEGDRLLVGSDGKDDIMLAGGEINHDENLFLEWVNQAEGDLTETIRLVHSGGELKDDISLLSLTWLNTAPELAQSFTSEEKNYYNRALAAYKEEEYGIALELLLEQFDGKDIRKEVMNLVSKIYLKQKMYRNYFKLHRNYYNFFPGDNRNLLRLASADYKLRKFEEALLWSESLYLRDPTDMENLQLLTKIYRRLGQLHKAQTLVEDARHINLDESYLLKLEESLKSKNAKKLLETAAPIRSTVGAFSYS